MTLDRAAATIALAVSLTLGLVAWSWRTGAVGGSDSACYALMAKAYAEGRVQPESALARVAPWPDPTPVAAPGGFLPSPVLGRAVPVCAPGYGLMTAPFVALAGTGAIHVVPPLAAALLAWTAFLLARRLAGAWAGAAAALLVACHPIVLFQAVQPMNDIVTAAIWVAVAFSVAAGRPMAAGSLIGLGLLVRPNLAPAAVTAVVVGAVLAAMTPAGPGRWRRGTLASVPMALAALPGVMVALLLNATLYGSPWRSGYGDLESLFALEHVPVNVARYGTTWLATSTPVALLSFAAPWILRGPSRRLAWGLAALAAALSSIYLVYRPFPEWWYLRFHLPAVVVSLVLTAGAVAAFVDRIGAAWPWRVAAVTVIVATAVWTARGTAAAEALTLQRLEARFALTAQFVASRLPAEAVLVTGWQSGAVRYGPGHEVVMWDALDPAWLDRAVAWLQETGRPPVIVLEGWEEEGFRRRFAGQSLGDLDWPPRYDIDRRVHVYLPADRDAYRRGDVVPTERVFASRVRD
jgi:hypothetical protein